ncbi:hypothetical protein H5410_050431 [Solanum commersonii]|uniref:Uncharacterized protein n=1 Tax=Solanum commersonii TaxID=4109 RepID=A0A9J5WXK5_SOLCO|nr:hypothetical protein H5410_050431 [Solanum commersonii]
MLYTNGIFSIKSTWNYIRHKGEPNRIYKWLWTKGSEEMDHCMSIPMSVLYYTWLGDTNTCVPKTLCSGWEQTADMIVDHTIELFQALLYGNY